MIANPKLETGRVGAARAHAQQQARNDGVADVLLRGLDRAIDESGFHADRLFVADQTMAAIQPKAVQPRKKFRTRIAAVL